MWAAHVDEPTRKHTLALNNALFAAALHGHLHIVRYLVGDCRADVHAADDGDDLTPFMVAVEHGHLKILQCFRTVHAEDIGVEGIAERPAIHIAQIHYAYVGRSHGAE